MLHLFQAAVHFLSIETGFLGGQAAIDNLVASRKSLRCDVWLERDQIKSVNFLLCLDEVVLDLVDHLDNLLGFLQILNCHFNIWGALAVTVETVV